jgi:hypothetical protein
MLQFTFLVEVMYLKLYKLIYDVRDHCYIWENDFMHTHTHIP